MCTSLLRSVKALLHVKQSTNCANTFLLRGGYGNLQLARQLSAEPAPLLEEEFQCQGEEPEAGAQHVYASLLQLLTGYQHAGERLRERQEKFKPAVNPAMWHLAPLRGLLAAQQAGSSTAGFSPREEAVLDLWNEQLRLETQVLSQQVLMYKKDRQALEQLGRATHMWPAEKLLLAWFAPLRDEIEREQARVLAREQAVDRGVYGPYLALLPPAELAVLALHGALNLLLVQKTSGECHVTKVALSMGKAVQAQINLELLKQHVRNENQARQQKNRAVRGALRQLDQAGGALPAEQQAELQERVPELADELSAALTPAQRAQGLEGWLSQSEGEITKRLRLMQRKFTRLDGKGGATNKHVKVVLKEDYANWGQDICAKVGVALLKLMIDTCKVKIKDPKTGEVVEESAFRHAIDVQWDGTVKKGLWKRYGSIKCHPEVLVQLNSDHRMRESFLPRYQPMVVEPLPWVRHDRGGYLTGQNKVMRVRGQRLQYQKLAEAHMQEPHGLRKVYAALNALGSTPWRINGFVYDTVNQLYEGGGALADLPARDNEPVPPYLPRRFGLQAQDGQLLATMTDPPEWERLQRANLRRKVNKRNAEMHSLRCDFRYKLEVAREFLHTERFYFPHNLDFRGRAYPIHSHLCHLGNDMCRGILVFADGRPLGPTGLDWLFVQVANLYGQGADKLSQDGRREFVQNNLDAVLDSARNPLNGSRWWLQGDSPWQLLATCREIADAIDSGDPASFVSHLPVHQDGSCNGLQHYAALGRDKPGGQAVNLLPMSEPQDVYMEIAKLVMQRVERDAEEGHEEALALRGEVDRKLVKQTVMTSVYGVTFIGARMQIGNRLKERGWDDEHKTYRVSCYAAKITLLGLHEMFRSAKDTMQWLGMCAKLVAKADEPVAWTTPLGLPVVQPYRRKDKHHVRTLLQRIVLTSNRDDLPVQKSRQRSAFPPNYIHSIDSTHMLMTAIACKEAGLAFAGVHDSFWTHAASVETMNRLLRDKFVELHQQPLLEDLRRELQERHPKVKFPEVPKTGELDLNDIRSSVYFFN